MNHFEEVSIFKILLFLDEICPNYPNETFEVYSETQTFTMSQALEEGSWVKRAISKEVQNLLDAYKTCMFSRETDQLYFHAYPEACASPVETVMRNAYILRDELEPRRVWFNVSQFLRSVRGTV